MRYNIEMNLSNTLRTSELITRHTQYTRGLCVWEEEERTRRERERREGMERVRERQKR